MKTPDETVVATIPAENTADDGRRAERMTHGMTAEDDIRQDTQLLQKQVDMMRIEDQAGYKHAVEISKNIKRGMKAVTDFMAPIKKNAAAVHKAACDRENELLKPLKAMDNTIRANINNYLTEQERKRREAEEAIRKAKEEEERRLLEQAIAAEQKGDAVTAEETFEAAQVMSEAMPIVPTTKVEKVAGTAIKTDWEAVITDPAAVPVDVMGACIRPVDMAAVMRLVRATKGNIKIPGIEIKEVKKAAIRG